MKHREATSPPIPAKAFRAIRTRTVRASKLRAGDVIVDRRAAALSEVLAAWNEPDGIWLETADGAQRFVKHRASFTVAR